MEVHILSTCSPPGEFYGLKLQAVCNFTRTCMHVTAQGHLETLYTAISIKVVRSFQAYATRPKGSVGSFKCVLASRLLELQIS